MHCSCMQLSQTVFPDTHAGTIFAAAAGCCLLLLLLVM
jgi:hypothetical protein